MTKIAGFDTVKFQKRTIEKVYSKEILDSKRKSMRTTQREQKEGLEFNFGEYKIIDDYCKLKKDRLVCFCMGYRKS